MMRTINKSVFCILQVLILSIICNAQQPNRLKSFISRSASSVQNYPRHPKTSHALLNVVTRSLVPEQLINWYFDEAGELERPSDNNTQCFQQILEFSIGLVGAEPWAIQMLDSSSKIPAGILMGNIKDIGFYDECISIKVDRNNETIQGRHCLYSVAAEENEMIAPTFSICLPSACNVPDLRNVLENLIVVVNNIANVSIGVQSVTCTAVGPEPLDLGTILTIVFLSVYIGYLVCCTIYDFYLRFIGGKSTSTLVKFSIYTNALRVLDTEVRRENIPAIQGIRFFSMCWVILGHTYFKQTMGIVANGADVITWMKSWTSLYVLTAPFTVDTFFVIGGFLTSYLFMKEMAKGTKFNIFMYYLHRYLRLTPALAVLLLLTIFIFPKIGSGALWELNMKEQEITCKSNWWPMLLYVQNYVNTDNIMCLGHLWYLAVDMQLFWISPIILYPLAWKPKIGLSLSGALLIASVIIPAVISVQHKYSGALFTTLDIDEVIDFMIKFYMVTYTRCGAWLLGILLGYFLSQEKCRPSISFIITGWILAIVSFAFIFFSYRVFQSDDYTYNLYWEVFYNGFSRHIWSFGVCWLLYASIRGYPGIISKFLSLPIFMPFARISYCVYLFHFIYQIMNVSAARVPIYFSDWYVFTSFFSDFILSTFGGFVFCLLFESPFMVLEKIFFKKKEGRRQEYGSREKLEEIENGEVCTPHDNYSTQNGLDNGGFRVNQIEE